MPKRNRSSCIPSSAEHKGYGYVNACQVLTDEFTAGLAQHSADNVGLCSMDMPATLAANSINAPKDSCNMPAVALLCLLQVNASLNKHHRQIVT
jgi:hypothetical protein